MWHSGWLGASWQATQRQVCARSDCECVVCVGLLCCVWLVGAFAYMCVLSTQQFKGVKHGMIVRFEYAVWYLQEEEELCIWALVVVQQHRTPLWHWRAAPWQTTQQRQVCAKSDLQMCRLRCLLCLVSGCFRLYVTDTCEPPTQQRKGFKHGMLIVRFEYVVWYLQEEELCICSLVVAQHRTPVWHYLTALWQTTHRQVCAKSDL